MALPTPISPSPQVAVRGSLRRVAYQPRHARCCTSGDKPATTAPPTACLWDAGNELRRRKWSCTSTDAAAHHTVLRARLRELLRQLQRLDTEKENLQCQLERLVAHDSVPDDAHLGNDDSPAASSSPEEQSS